MARIKNRNPTVCCKKNHELKSVAMKNEETPLWKRQQITSNDCKSVRAIDIFICINGTKFQLYEQFCPNFFCEFTLLRLLNSLFSMRKPQPFRNKSFLSYSKNYSNVNGVRRISSVAVYMIAFNRCHRQFAHNRIFFFFFHCEVLHL